MSDKRIDQNHGNGAQANAGLPATTGNVARSDRFLNIALLLVIVVALITTILMIVLPKENEDFTEFFILDSDRMAFGYPDEIVAGQKYPMFIGVENHEKRTVTYTIEIWNLNAAFEPSTNTTHINTMDPGDRFSFTLADTETTIIPYSVSVGKKDYNRVVFLLFNDTAPPGSVLAGGSDRINASYQNLYLHVVVR